MCKRATLHIQNPRSRPISWMCDLYALYT